MGKGSMHFSIFVCFILSISQLHVHVRIFMQNSCSYTLALSCNHVLRHKQFFLFFQTSFKWIFLLCIAQTSHDTWCRKLKKNILISNALLLWFMFISTLVGNMSKIDTNKKWRWPWLWNIMPFLFYKFYYFQHSIY